MDDATIEERLTALERESDARRAELRALAAQVPAAVSRREVVRRAVDDLVRAPDKWGIARRGLRKLARAPRALWRRLAS
jgi:hypothetical protein